MFRSLRGEEARLIGSRLASVPKSRERALSDKVVAVGLLTQRDLDVLGRQFTRHLPIPQDANQFADLLRKLEEIPAVRA